VYKECQHNRQTSNAFWCPAKSHQALSKPVPTTCTSKYNSHTERDNTQREERRGKEGQRIVCSDDSSWQTKRPMPNLIAHCEIQPAQKHCRQ